MGLLTGAGPNRPPPVSNPSVRIGQLRTEGAKNVPVARPRVHFLPPPPFQTDPRFEPKRPNRTIANRKCKNVPVGRPRAHFLPPLPFQTDPRFEPKRSNWPIVNRRCENMARGGLNRGFVYWRRPKPPPPFRTRASESDNCEPKVQKMCPWGAHGSIFYPLPAVSNRPPF